MKYKKYFCFIVEYILRYMRADEHLVETFFICPVWFLYKQLEILWVSDFNVTFHHAREIDIWVNLHVILILQFFLIQARVLMRSRFIMLVDLFPQKNRFQVCILVLFRLPLSFPFSRYSKFFRNRVYEEKGLSEMRAFCVCDDREPNVHPRTPIVTDQCGAKIKIEKVVGALLGIPAGRAPRRIVFGPSPVFSREQEKYAWVESRSETR